MIDIYFDAGLIRDPLTTMLEACVWFTENDIVYQNLGIGSHNAGEWAALLLAMVEASNRKLTHVNFIGDSQLVVYQAIGKYQVKAEHLKLFKTEFDRIQNRFVVCNVSWVKRDLNKAGIYLENTK